MTHKLFGNLSYSIICNGWTPFVGIGAEVEFAPCSNNSRSCLNNNSCAISQWGVWLKAGVGFE
jgi:hypothetical protein